MEYRLNGYHGIVLLSALCLYACAASNKSDGNDTADTSDTTVLFPDGGNARHRFTLDGFETPESALYDPEGDWILVSNINGGAGKEDGNGFISKVSMAGEMLARKWIDGESDDVTLNAPKGMAIRDTELCVTDITVVRFFERETGAPIQTININGATFLNDAASNGERIFISDSNEGMVYEIMADLTVASRLQTSDVGKPNGLFATAERLYVANADGAITAVDTGSFEKEWTIDTDAPRLDGLVVLDNEQCLASSWETHSVFIATQTAPHQPVIENLSSAADIGFVPDEHLVLIPLFSENRLMVAEIL